jgi:uncharacterized protein (DUF885 family)
MRTPLVAVVALSLGAACASAPPAPPAATAAAPSPAVDARRAKLRETIADYWEYVLRTSPEFASTLGDRRYNDKWSDYSEKAVFEDDEHVKAYLARLEAIDTTGFPQQERLDQVLLVRELKEGLAGTKFEHWLMPVNQFSSPHIDIPQLVSSASCRSRRSRTTTTTSRASGRCPRSSTRSCAT